MFTSLFQPLASPSGDPASYLTEETEVVVSDSIAVLNTMTRSNLGEKRVTITEESSELKAGT